MLGEPQLQHGDLRQPHPGKLLRHPGGGPQARVHPAGDQRDAAGVLNKYIIYLN